MPDRIADVATAATIGQRDRQEDAVIADFVDGSEAGFAVLSDGMGGHDDGDLASRIIVSEVYAAMNLSGREAAMTDDDVAARLHHAVLTANTRLARAVAEGTGQDGMGGTLVTTFLQGDSLRWISIGDSPLFVFRRGKLRQLNEIHSLAPQIDLMVSQGAMDAETARNHPQRDCLTSALVGAAINRIDCPTESFALERGDLLLMSSDGLLVLSQKEIARVLKKHRKAPSHQVAQALLRAVAQVDAPEQDNVAVIVIKPVVAPRVAARRPAHWWPGAALWQALRNRWSGPLVAAQQSERGAQ